jgi:hypothetical protein
MVTDVERTAHHEAGHVVFGYRWLGELPRYAEVRATEFGQGGCFWDAPIPVVNQARVSPRQREHLGRVVAMLTAGDAAAETLTGRRWPQLWLEDRAKARLIVNRYVAGVNETLDIEIERQRKVAMEFFAQPLAWAEVTAVARALLDASNLRLDRGPLLALMAELRGSG